jgi:putative pyruvate formate lyase activating enzyme
MPDYWNVVTGCIQRVYNEGQRVIVRHLLMPGHLNCCTLPVLHWLADHPGIEVSLLTQYLAPANARGELAATLNPSEVESAHALAHTLSLRMVT